MSDASQTSPGATRRCFVIMGFGVKTDLGTGRKLDLDKSYRLLIKPVVEESGLVCIRADEIRHSGMIDVPMYRELLTAEVVIADLSTSNPNALYELGIRHALRPHTTIVISENKLPYPFDLNHVAISSYAHLGDAIDFEEVMRFRKILGDTLAAVLDSRATDSPVYAFLRDLSPPSPESKAALTDAADALRQTGKAIADASNSLRTPEASQEDPTLALLIQQGERAIRNGEFATAKSLFGAALQIGKGSSKPGAIMNDSYLQQRLVLATYKSKEPDEVAALREGLGYLAALSPEESNDPETVGLAGAIEKRLFDKGEGSQHLDRAIWFYRRGYYLRSDWYNGINLAYLLNVRTDSSLDAVDEERIADLVWANRIRREVLALCDRDLQSIDERASHQTQNAEAIICEQNAMDQERKFWCFATRAEASFGLGNWAEYDFARRELEALDHAAWMMETLDDQTGRLKRLLSKHGHLLHSPWVAER